jgi:hypothetical protein
MTSLSCPVLSRTRQANLWPFEAHVNCPIRAANRILFDPRSSTGSHRKGFRLTKYARLLPRPRASAIDSCSECCGQLGDAFQRCLRCGRWTYTATAWCCPIGRTPIKSSSEYSCPEPSWDSRVNFCSGPKSRALLMTNAFLLA